MRVWGGGGGVQYTCSELKGTDVQVEQTIVVTTLPHCVHIPDRSYL